VRSRIGSSTRFARPKGALPRKRDLYERAFQRLKVAEQAALAARIEDGLSYEEIARELGKSSPDAARMAVTRAVVRLAQEMKNLRSR
jgi:DNA-directed RNA polymerase specialized sigma24 family protein